MPRSLRRQFSTTAPPRDADDSASVASYGDRGLNASGGSGLVRQPSSFARTPGGGLARQSSVSFLSASQDGMSQSNVNVGGGVQTHDDDDVLTEKQLDFDHEMVLKAENPHAPDNIIRFDRQDRFFRATATIDQTQLHFEMETKLFYVHSDEAKRQESIHASASVGTGTGGPAGGDDSIDGIEGAASTPGSGGGAAIGIGSSERLRNRFNSCPRHTQTFNFPMRERGTNTEPPTRMDIGGLINQYTIYKAYEEDLERLRIEKEKNKKRGPAAAEDEKKIVVPVKTTLSDAEIQRSDAYKRALKIMERMVNLNTYADIAHDYKYLDYAVDLDEDMPTKGTLMPLWSFQNAAVKKRSVTALAWNPRYKDLFAVGYGSYEFGRQRTGRVCCFSLKNPSFPEYSFQTESGVLCVDFHPGHTSLLAVGLYDGTVLVYDIKGSLEEPLYQSTIRSGKHTDPVWQVAWQEDDISDKHNFFSVSSDGRITSWTMVKSELRFTDIIRLQLADAGTQPDDADHAMFGYAGGLCFDFNRFSKHLFVVGTEEGKIHKCSKASNTQYLETYLGHHMAVYKVVWNWFHEDVFLSCSADWTVKVWDHNLPTPIMSFDLNNSVGDVAWAPYSSTVFAACTADGKVYVFDLNVNKHEPLCSQKVARKVELTRIAFNPDPTSYIILAGDNKGTVQSFRLSPNLRKLTVIEDEEDQPKGIFALQKAAAPAPVGDDGKPIVVPKKTIEELEREKLDVILVAQERSVISGM